MRKRDLSGLEKVLLTGSIVVIGTIAAMGFIKGCDYAAEKTAGYATYIESFFRGDK